MIGAFPCIENPLTIANVATFLVRMRVYIIAYYWCYLWHAVAERTCLHCDSIPEVVYSLFQCFCVSFFWWLPGNWKCRTHACYLQHNKYTHTNILTYFVLQMSHFSLAELLLHVLPCVGLFFKYSAPQVMGWNPVYTHGLIQFVIVCMDSANSHSNSVQSNPD